MTSRRWRAWRTTRARCSTPTPCRRPASWTIAVDALGVDALTLSAHKLHGPKGVGAAYIRRGVPFTPLTAGGHQERERRAGTENVSGIVGFGVAARLAAADLANAAARVGALRDRLEARLLAIPGARRNGDGAQRLPGTLNVGFAGAPGQFVAAALDLEGISVSTGAACTSGSLAPSEVLLALGLSAEEAGCAIRFGIGAGNTEEEIERVGGRWSEDVVRRVRGATTTRRDEGDDDAGSGRGSSSRCRAASIRPPRRRCWWRGDTRSSARRCGSTTRAARPPASAGAAAGRATSRTRARRPRISASPTT